MRVGAYMHHGAEVPRRWVVRGGRRGPTSAVQASARQTLSDLQLMTSARHRPRVCDLMGILSGSFLACSSGWQLVQGRGRPCARAVPAGTSL